MTSMMTSSKAPYITVKHIANNHPLIVYAYVLVGYGDSVSPYHSVAFLYFRKMILIYYTEST